MFFQLYCLSFAQRLLARIFYILFLLFAHILIFARSVPSSSFLSLPTPSPSPLHFTLFSLYLSHFFITNFPSLNFFLSFSFSYTLLILTLLSSPLPPLFTSLPRCLDRLQRMWQNSSAISKWSSRVIEITHLCTNSTGTYAHATSLPSCHVSVLVEVYCAPSTFACTRTMLLFMDGLYACPNHLTCHEVISQVNPIPFLLPFCHLHLPSSSPPSPSPSALFICLLYPQLL